MSALVVWSSLVYFLGQKTQLQHHYRWYYFAIVVIFCIFKFDAFDSGHKNALLDSIVPIGFSFIMFQSIAYLRDLKQNELHREHSYLTYLGGTLFFPTLLAGPFCKFQVYLDGLNSSWNHSRVFHGFALASMGLCKFALSGFIVKNSIIGSMPLVPTSETHSLNLLILGSIYLYLNFSGYSDFVVGLGKLLGFEIPLNFKFPYLSTSMAEYWRNWHITLGHWFRDQVFFPLSHVLNRKLTFFSTRHNTKIAVFVTFFLIGIWHEFSWQVLFYALANAFFVTFLSPTSIRQTQKLLLIPLNFFSIILINGIFVSKSLDDYFGIVKRLAIFDPEKSFEKEIRLLLFSIVLLLFIYFSEKTIEKLAQYELLSPWDLFKTVLLTGVLILLTLTVGFSGVEATYVGY